MSVLMKDITKIDMSKSKWIPRFKSETPSGVCGLSVKAFDSSEESEKGNEIVTNINRKICFLF